MALQPTELYETQAISGIEKVGPTRVMPKQFAAGTALLAYLTPVAFDTTALTWKVWANAGINGVNLIHGFVGEREGVQLVAGGEVMGNVILGGYINHADIPVPAGETQGNMDTALKVADLVVRGLFIRGLLDTET